MPFGVSKGVVAHAIRMPHDTEIRSFGNGEKKRTTSWRRTFESLRVAFPHVSHRFTLGLAFLGSPLVGLFGYVWFGLFLFVCLFVFVLFWEAPHDVEMA